MNHETTIEVDGERYYVQFFSVRSEIDLPRLIELARHTIRGIDRKPLSATVEVDGVLVRIGGPIEDVMPFTTPAESIKTTTPSKTG